MNPFYSIVKEEYPSNDGGTGSSSGGTTSFLIQIPQPMEGLHDSGPPPFLTKIYDMVEDQSVDHIVSWSRNGQSFVVLDPHAFSTNLLPRYFKHNNFSSFVRQLNTYGFRKIDPDIWEFANEAFVRGQRHVLKNIKRRRAPPGPPQQQAIGSGLEGGNSFGLDEVGRLKQEKQVLTMELVKLRQQQENTRARIQEMEMRLQGTEKKQQKMMGFLAKAMQNPDFIQKLVQVGKRKELELAFLNHNRELENGESSETIVKPEPEEFADNNNSYGFQVSELEALALEIQGFGKPKRNQENLEEENGEKELDDEFWEELFSERCDSDEQSVNFLADKLDFLGSSPK